MTVYDDDDRDVEVEDEDVDVDADDEDSESCCVSLENQTIEQFFSIDVSE